MSELRYVLGPSFSATPPTPPPDVAPQGDAKLDVAVTLGAIDEVAWTIEVDVPAYDLATHNQLAEVRTYLATTGPPFSNLPVSADGWLSSPYPVAVEDVSNYQDGAKAVVNLPSTPPGVKHLGQVVLGFVV